MKHTSGPWDIWTDREQNEIYGKAIGINIVAENHRTSVGTVHGMRSNDESVRETAAANARLIAAAPDLLAACDELLEGMIPGEKHNTANVTLYAIGMIREAIRKATTL